jgi:hypothetical protein
MKEVHIVFSDNYECAKVQEVFSNLEEAEDLVKACIAYEESNKFPEWYSDMSEIKEIYERFESDVDLWTASHPLKMSYTSKSFFVQSFPLQ